MCTYHEREETREERKKLMDALDEYVEARVRAVLEERGIKSKCPVCGKET